MAEMIGVERTETRSRAKAIISSMVRGVAGRNMMADQASVVETRQKKEKGNERKHRLSRFGGRREAVLSRHGE